MKPPVFSPVRSTAPGPVYEPPQYAEFDVSKKGGDDALPSMPTWGDAGSKKVAVEEDGVEMNRLNPAATGQTVASASAAAAASAAAVAAAAGQPSPSMSGGNRSPYRQPSPVAASGYAGQAVGYANQPQGQNYNNGYGQPSSPYGADPYAAGAMAPAPRMASPHQDYNNNNGNGYNQYGNSQGYGAGSQGYDNGYSSQGYGGDYSQTPQVAQAYGMDPRRPSPASAAYGADPMRHSPTPQADYGYGQQQQYGAGAGYRQPQAQQSAGLQNSGGFDFNSGYSRPHDPYNDYGHANEPQELPASNGYAAYSPRTAQRPNGGY